MLICIIGLTAEIIYSLEINILQHHTLIGEDGTEASEAIPLGLEVRFLRKRLSIIL